MSKYLTDDHFDKMARVMVIVSLVYLYFNINEFLVPGYKMEKFDALHLNDLFVGKYAPMFWFVQIGGIILPIILFLFKSMRRPLPMMIVSAIVVIASWFKRFIIVVPTLDNPYLPKQHYPDAWMFYKPTLIETLITMASVNSCPDDHIGIGKTFSCNSNLGNCTRKKTNRK